MWRDPAPGGGPPNDWVSQFRACGSAWTLDERTGQYYLHSFMPEQPDLNWENPDVAAAMHDTLRFWLDRGVDGFRLDAIHKIAKDPLLRDHAGAPRRHDEDWDSIHGHLRGIRRVVDDYEDRMIVGEVALQDLHRIVGYLESGDQLHLAHNFVWAELPWDADAFRTSIGDFEALADETAWPAWFLANHDLPRVRERFGADGLGEARARAVALMLYALRGTPFIYQGEELALPHAEIPPERVVDVDGRDPVRSPMPWRPGPGGGFTDGEPWLPLVAGGGRAVGRGAGRRPALDAHAGPPARRPAARDPGAADGQPALPRRRPGRARLAARGRRGPPRRGGELRGRAVRAAAAGGHAGALDRPRSRGPRPSRRSRPARRCWSARRHEARRRSAGGDRRRRRAARPLRHASAGEAAAAREGGAGAGAPEAGRADRHRPAASTTPFSSIQVRAELTRGRLTGVETLALTGADAHTNELNARAEPILREEALAAGSADIDVVSGATGTSESWIESLRAAIRAARRG